MAEPTNTRFDDVDPPAPLKFERRRSTRWSFSGRATVCRLGGYEFGRLHDIRLVDYSDGGVGAETDLPLAPGTIISIGAKTVTIDGDMGRKHRMSIYDFNHYNNHYDADRIARRNADTMMCI